MLRESLPKIITDLPGPKSAKVIQQRKESVVRGVACAAPCAIKRGEGAMIEDLDGNIFMDWVAGIGVLNVGYSHPQVLEAIQKQLPNYLHPSSNIIHYPEYGEVCQWLNENVPVKGDHKKTILVNSGAEALENAVKIARKFQKKDGIVVFTGAYHGRTLLTMSMTAKVKPYKVGMGPFAPSIHRCSFPYAYHEPNEMTEDEAVEFYLARLERFFLEFTAPETTAAIVLEPVLGEGGFVIPPLGYIKGLRKFCDDNNILLIADEVQTGYARTGRMFASEYWQEVGAEPDMLASAKSIAAGLPLSSVTGRAEIMDTPGPGEIGGTFCGNPLACVAALEVFDIIKDEKLCERALEINKKCMPIFKEWQQKYEIVGDVRGLGAMMALEFVKDKSSKKANKEVVATIISRAAQKGLIIASAGVLGNVIRFLMPLVITDKQIEAGLAILEDEIKALSQ